MSKASEADLVDSMISIIRAPTIERETARLAALVMHTDFYFVMRLKDRSKPAMSEDRLSDVLDFYDEVAGDAHAIACNVTNGLSNQEAQISLKALQKKIADYEI